MSYTVQPYIQQLSPSPGPLQMVYIQTPQGPSPVFIQTQPSPAPLMVVSNRNPRNLPVGPNGKREWTQPLFEGCDGTGNCLIATFCCCLAYGRTQSKLKALEAGSVAPEGGSSANEDCCLFAIVEPLFCLHSYFLCAERETLQERYGIEGAGFGDCALSLFCHPCVQTQHLREMEEEEAAMLAMAAAPHY